MVLTRTRRGVPPAQWILNNARLLEEIFGRACLRAFHECAEDRARANWTTVYTANGKRLELGYVYVLWSPLMVVPPLCRSSRPFRGRGLLCC